MADAERTLGWWFVWNKRRDVDDYRAWSGRDAQPGRRSTFRDYAPLYDSGVTAPSTSFEDELCDEMDFMNAWPKLPLYQQRVLALKAAGYSDKDAATKLGKTPMAVCKQRSLARRTLRELCEVRY